MNDDPDHATRQAALVVVAVNRIAAIAQAIDLGIGYSTLGEDELITALLGQARALNAEAMPFDPTQICSVRLSLTLLDALVEHAEALHRTLANTSRDPPSRSLDVLRCDFGAHLQAVRQLRYAPASQLFDGLAAYVEQLAAFEDKQARLITAGSAVWLDRAHIPTLRHMLCHLLRNAIAHGIEVPTRRVALGKPEMGEISLAVIRQPGSISILVSDDGQGVDYDALASRATDLACSTADLSAPGVTARDTPSAIAGRGVGLDAVRIALERLDGLLELTNRPGAGFTATLILPELTLADD